MNPLNPEVIKALQGDFQTALIVVVLAEIAVIMALLGGMFGVGRLLAQAIREFSRSVKDAGQANNKGVSELGHKVDQRFDSLEEAIKGVAKDVKVLVIYQQEREQRKPPGFFARLLSFEQLGGD